MVEPNGTPVIVISGAFDLVVLKAILVAFGAHVSK